MTLSKERKYILIVGGILLLLGLIYRYAPSLEGIFTPDDTIELKEQKLENYRRIAKKRKPSRECKTPYAVTKYQYHQTFPRYPGK